MATSEADTRVNQPTAAPTQKVAAATLGGAVTVIAVWALGQFGIDLPSEVAASVAVLVAAVAGYFTRDKVHQVEG